MHKYSIGDLERLSGIKAHTIRMWERRYGVIDPGRTQTNIRYYNEDDLLRILNISILKQIGYRISKIANLSNEDLKNYVLTNIIESDNPEVQIETLVVALFSIDEYRFFQGL
jgi:DNA-binding transcriptional MerR regulator